MRGNLSVSKPTPQTSREVGKVSIGNLRLESGYVLPDVTLAYERCGNRSGPSIVVCHALTGNQFAVGTEDEPGWWSGLIGCGKAVDTDVYQIITFNVLGGCQGSTGPTSLSPDGSVYRMKFPRITVRDMVHAQKMALDQLGIHHVQAVIGGSLGGMQVFEWGVMYPTFMDQLFILAATPYLSDYGIAFNRIGIAAIENDPHWKNGNYLHSSEVKGFHIARMAGLVTYRSDDLFNGRFERQMNQSTDFPYYEVESYLQYQGEKLANRFDVNSYLYLLHAMNSHDIGRGRGGWKKVASTYEAEVIGVAFQHDLIYSADVLKRFTEIVPNGTFYYVETPFGHDGFLTEFNRWDDIIRTHLKPKKQAQAR
jgi:homoserine O-acetyltransferase/O-succinyltransferase